MTAAIVVLCLYALIVIATVVAVQQAVLDWSRLSAATRVYVLSSAFLVVAVSTTIGGFVLASILS